MKLNKLWAAAALALALVSCKSEALKEPVQQKMKFPVAISLDGGKYGAMRATETGKTISASDPYERLIKNLTIVVFTNNNTTNLPIAVEKVITYDELTKPTDPYKGEFKFDMGMAGTFQLEVIANGYDDADKDAFIDQFEQGMSYDQFKRIVINNKSPQELFAMLSTEPKKITTLANETADAGTIKLRRLICRFDVFNKLTDELKLEVPKLQNIIIASYLITQRDIPSDADGGVANALGLGSTYVNNRIFSYENPIPGATKLLLEGSYKGQPWQKLIEFKDADGNYIAIQRNHLYRVFLTKGGGNEADKDNITYNIEVLDWDEDVAMDYSENDLLHAEYYVNPLEYVAERNIDRTGTNYTNMYDLSGYDLYSFNTAVAKFSNITIEGEACHLPSLDEWLAIIPATVEGSVHYPVRFSADKASSLMNVEQKVVVAGKSINCLQDFKKVAGDMATYALRFKGTSLQSAWKYDVIEGYNDGRVMRVTSRLVADGVTIEDVIKGSFWTQNNGRDIVRFFPLPSAGINPPNCCQFYCTSSLVDEHKAYALTPFLVTDTNKYPPFDGRVSLWYLDLDSMLAAVRLFKDTL